jgi:hypothetical protein
VSAVRPKSANMHGRAHVDGQRGSVVTNLTKVSEQRRDKLLLALLKTPPQPRAKRERDKSKAAYSDSLGPTKSGIKPEK